MSVAIDNLRSNLEDGSYKEQQIFFELEIRVCGLRSLCEFLIEFAPVGTWVSFDGDDSPFRQRVTVVEKDGKKTVEFE